jgi:hypothetical protein
MVHNTQTHFDAVMKLFNSDYYSRLTPVLLSAKYEEEYGIVKRRRVPLDTTKELLEIDHQYQCGIINLAMHKRTNRELRSSKWCIITKEPDEYLRFIDDCDIRTDQLTQLRTTICD